MLQAALVGGSIAGNIAGGIMGGKQAKQAAAQEAAFREKAFAELTKLKIPPIEAQKIILETPNLVFDYVPQLEVDFPEIKSAMTEIQSDPRLKDAQMTALAGIQERAMMGGLSPEEQAELNAMRRGTAQQAQSQQQSILQEMEAMGRGGSGSELMARLASTQAATQRAGEESDRLAAMSFQAKQAALGNLANVSGNIREQDFGEQAKVATAADEIARFNQQNRATTQQRNVGSMNQAQLQREGLKQDLESQRVAARQQEEVSNKGLIQQDYQNKLNLAQAKAAALTGQGQAAGQAGATQAANTTKMASGIGDSLLGAAKLLK
jgi:hypothetical protein